MLRTPESPHQALATTKPKEPSKRAAQGFYNAKLKGLCLYLREFLSNTKAFTLDKVKLCRHGHMRQLLYGGLDGFLRISIILQLACEVSLVSCHIEISMS